MNIIKRNQIIIFLDRYLKIDKWPDDYHNGLEIRGANEIKKIVTGVTPSMELFKKAKKAKAQMIITHHYLHLKGEKYHPAPKYDLKRVEYLKKNNLNFLNYHLSLDFHNEIGNEVLTLKQFGFEVTKPKFYYNGGLYGGKLKKATNIRNIILKGEKIYSVKPYVLKFGPKRVTNIAIITGSGSGFFEKAFKKGTRTIITGNPKVETPDVAKELNLNIIALGHHNTEKVGIKTLGELVSERFNIKHEFIDIPNPI